MNSSITQMCGTLGIRAGVFSRGVLALGVRTLGVQALSVLASGVLASSVRAFSILALSALGLGGSAAASAASGVPMGLYRAVLTLPGGELPVGLDLEREGTATVGYLLNGPERLKLDEVTVAGSHLDIRMPGYENRLIAD